MNGLTYLLYVEGDTIPMEGSVTLGNHLDNDIVIAGEDVADFHVRISLDDRGPELIPLGRATVNVNGHEHDAPIRVMIGDTIGIGVETIQVGVEQEVSDIQIHGWKLVPEAGLEIEISGETSVGRSEEAGITLNDTHVSRIHARFVEKNQMLWLQDLKSANGTRVNGNRIHGAMQLYHGDQISFDRHSFQLVAESDELTPVNRFVDPLRGTNVTPPGRPSPARSEVDSPAAPTATQLEVISGPLPRDRINLNSGVTSLGSSSECQIYWQEDHAVKYAEVQIDANGSILTRQTGLDVVALNDKSIDRSRLAEGDIIKLGESEFVFRVNVQSPQSGEDSEPLGNVKIWIYVGIGMIALVALSLLLL